MLSLTRLFQLLLVGATCATSPHADATPDTPMAPSALQTEIEALDTALFDAFNHCADAEQLKRFTNMLAPNLEFYHDRDGRSDKKTMVANTKKNACAKYRRELIPNSLRVFPIGKDQAMEIGHHKFCSIADGSCPGQGEFLTLWTKTKSGWLATRMLSYDHKAAQ
ncbi:MAG: nuclear transport factor 2 family protein [Burkholderiales bacterium]|nr:nuclear transport factor 2 family protein [Burkholderiales bacterium]